MPIMALVGQAKTGMAGAGEMKYAGCYAVFVLKSAWYGKAKCSEQASTWWGEAGNMCPVRGKQVLPEALRLVVLLGCPGSGVQVVSFCGKAALSMTQG